MTVPVTELMPLEENGPLDERYERKTTANGKFMFNLKATNGQVIGSSEKYESEAARNAGIDSVKRHAAEASLDDRTD